jgi:hypothetical protein
MKIGYYKKIALAIVCAVAISKGSAQQGQTSYPRITGYVGADYSHYVDECSFDFNN